MPSILYNTVNKETKSKIEVTVSQQRELLKWLEEQNSKELIPKVHCIKVYVDWLLRFNISLNIFPFQLETLNMSKKC